MRGAPRTDCLPESHIIPSDPPTSLSVQHYPILQIKKEKLRQVKGLPCDICHHDQASVSPCLDHSNSLFKPANDCDAQSKTWSSQRLPKFCSLPFPSDHPCPAHQLSPHWPLCYLLQKMAGTFHIPTLGPSL